MTSRETSITLKSRQAYGRELPPAMFGAFLERLAPATRQSVQMAFQHRSISRGRVPSWLDAASDIRFIGHHAEDGDTVLLFDGPTLGDAAEEVYRQGEFWPQRPLADDTALDLFADVVGAVAGGDPDSDQFDSHLLRTIGGFKRSLGTEFTSATIRAPRPREIPPVLDSSLVNSARAMSASAPNPRNVRIVGKLDMVRASTQTFALMLDDGTELRGVLTNGDIRETARSLQERVLVRGQLVYKPSGRPLRVDAESVDRAATESELWSRLPPPNLEWRRVSSLRQPQGPRTGVASIIGKWPGDESEEELTEALEQLS